jgi:hypothetical protein
MLFEKSVLLNVDGNLKLCPYTLMDRSFINAYTLFQCLSTYTKETITDTKSPTQHSVAGIITIVKDSSGFQSVFKMHATGCTTVNIAVANHIHLRKVASWREKQSVLIL